MITSRLGALVAAFMTFSMQPLAAAETERGVETSRCKDAITDLVARTGATFDHASPSGNNVFLEHEAAKSLSLDCRSSNPHLSVDASIANAFPPKAYYELIATAAAVVTMRDPRRIKVLAERCHRAALKSEDETEELHAEGLQLDCQAFVRDGGSTDILVVLDP